MSSLLLPRRRVLLGACAAGTLGGLSSIFAHAQAPAAITPDRARPGFPSGVQSGDVQADRAVVWARSDRPARMWVEWAATASFANAKRLRGPYAQEGTDHSARIDLTGLPAGQEIFYRVHVGRPRRRRTVASRCPATFAPRRPGGAATCASCGRATPPGRAGGSMRNSAA